MCIFSGPVKDVSETSIFNRRMENDYHALVYGMTVDAPQAVAMILPIPVKRGTGDDAVTFINLEGYEGFFDDMSDCFPAPITKGSRGRMMNKSLSFSMPLVVHSVGDFVASYVPSQADFDRLDQQFRLPVMLWDKMPRYKNFGFAVFQLKPSKAPVKVHPMAFSYPPENPDQLFFPTTHVHDGGHVPSEEAYDHALYYQAGQNIEGVNGFDPGEVMPKAAMQIEKTKGLVLPDTTILRRRIKRVMQNCDHVVGDSMSLVMPG